MVRGLVIAILLAVTPAPASESGQPLQEPRPAPSPSRALPDPNEVANAQWQLALSLLRKGDYQGALQALDDSMWKHPRQSFCGNGNAQYAYEAAVYRGVTLEYLGDYSTAIKYYLKALLNDGLYSDPTAAIRVAELYESCGQFDDLKVFAERLSTDHTLGRVVDLWDLHRKAELGALVQRLVGPRTTFLQPWEAPTRGLEWQADLAAALLARHPESSVPLLEAELGRVGMHDFVYYALGLCGTTEASELLRAALLDGRNAGYLMTLNYALSIGGAPGKARLDDLERTHPELIRFRSYSFPRHSFLEAGIEFPTLPTKLRLPLPVMIAPVPPGQ